MRYEIYDEHNKLFRKFWDRAEAQKFLQPGWKMAQLLCVRWAILSIHHSLISKAAQLIKY